MADEGSGGDRYPYKTPRWILWVVALVSVGAVVAAFVVGPKDDKTAGPGTTAPTTDAISPTDPSPTTDVASGLTAAATTEPPTTKAPTTASPSTTTSPKSTTTAPPTTAPQTTPPTTAPPTTPVTALQPPPTAAVTVSACRIEGASTLIADGTITNQGTRSWSFTATANGTDGSGNVVATVSVRVNAVQPGSTVPWEASADVGAAANRITNCPRSGVGTAL